MIAFIMLEIKLNLKKVFGFFPIPPVHRLHRQLVHGVRNIPAIHNLTIIMINVFPTFQKHFHKFMNSLPLTCFVCGSDQPLSLSPNQSDG